MGDMTAHGGSIVLGFPMELFGGQPAARMGDMHVCPMVTPGVPPIPHVGGPVVLGSPTVLIGGTPAARMGDMAVCVGPPDSIVLGCFTVLIGEAGGGGGRGGGGGGGGGAGASASSATAKAAESITADAVTLEVDVPGQSDAISWGVFSAQASALGAMQGRQQATQEEQEHWIRFEFVDSAGLPVNGVPYTFTGPDGTESSGVTSSEGRISRSSLPSAGQGKVVLQGMSEAEWSVAEAAMGETVKMSAKVEGAEPGAEATFTVYQRDLSGADRAVEKVEAQVNGTQVEAEWELVYLPDQPGKEDDTGEIVTALQKYSAPEYYFEVAVKQLQTRSGMMVYKDYVEIELKDEDGNPMAGEDYVVYLSNGEVRQGKLDSNGYMKEENIPPVFVHVAFPGYRDVRK
jgi:uncharacterized Zn-binding protein involved in type VI secretion